MSWRRSVGVHSGQEVGVGEGIYDSSRWREFAIHSTGGNPRAPGDEQKKSGLQRQSPG